MLPTVMLIAIARLPFDFSWPDWAAAIAFLGLWGGLWLPVAGPLARRWQWRPGATLLPGRRLALLGSLYVWVPPLVWVWARWRGEALADYGWTPDLRAFAGLAAGAIAGAAELAVAWGLQLRLGWARWQGSAVGVRWQQAAPLLVLALAIAAVEEVVFRGVLVQVWLGRGAIAAALLSSAIFAIAHGVWDGRAVLKQLPGLVLMGVVLVLARAIAGGNLGLACGLHAGWVWALATQDATEIVVPTDAAPRWATGDGQPLAGAFGLGCVAIAGLVLAALWFGGVRL